MTAPETIETLWLQFGPMGDIESVSDEPCEDHTPWVKRCDHMALIAAAYYAAGKKCTYESQARLARQGLAGQGAFNGIAAMHGQVSAAMEKMSGEIRALTPPDAQAALQAMIDAAERRGMQVAIDLINENTSPMVAPPTWSRDEAEGYENGQMDAAQSFIHKINAKIGGASNA